MPDADLMYAIGLPPEKAIEYFKAKGYQITWNWYEMLNEAHAKAFTVAKAMNLDILQDIRGMVQKALDEGITSDTFVKELEPTLKAKGWWGKVMGEDGKEVQLGSPRRLKNIYRNNLQSAYMAGRYQAFMENVDDRPYWQYVAVLDGRTRPAHAQLHGKVFRYDDPFWNDFYPPIDWGCRCRVRALDHENVQERNLRVEKTSPENLTTEDRIMPMGIQTSVGLYKDPVTGEKTVTGKGWSNNPGAAWQMDVMAYEKSLELPPNIRQKFIGEMARAKIHQEMFPSWVDGILAKQKAKGFAITVGWMDDVLLNKLREKGAEPKTPVIVTNDKNIMHAIRDAKILKEAALSVDEIKRIPEVIRNPEAILFDAEKQNILYVFSSGTDDRKNKIVVEINWDLKKKGVVNFVNTAGKVSLYNLREKKYTVIKGVLE
ncbi:hypothetical protein BIY37_04735 [Candidatus Brocadia sapporoensis]|uniref:Phage head morphogenesis domain-containing protein n=1 Tax=Candidatus Brocadia sapporoensis TaxID=392547 RepID=A0A1V6M171_9BACT|nr:phage minor head protein [Candidatus Brocadia sapporoensis]MDG6005541.1 phage head morphogenesis protein [Candidatus Brocadia sp.]OQD46130.1 hypothetical protein BIY37_04735 [Candidatus Brocadia sapporoensis]GJQ23583.1 MAG: phage morphogenesis protein [Candidatus Brocadia sapporoensis]